MKTLLELLEKWIRMTAFQTEAPKIYGPFHILMTLAMLAGAFFLYLALRNRPVKQKKKLLFVFGCLMALSEVWKQLFVYFIMTEEGYNWWYFPWQICSMPMYLCIAQYFLKGKAANAVYAFLASYGMSGALLALILPMDMLRIYPVLTMHGFLWHGLMCAEALLAVTLIPKEQRKEAFLHSILLLLCLAGIAEIINTIGDRTAVRPSYAPDMFYISPFRSTGQPFFSTVEKQFGEAAEIAVYLSTFCAGSSVVYCLNAYLNDRIDAKYPKQDPAA